MASASINPQHPESFPLAGSATSTLGPGSFRINSIDILRGIVMVVMMLDHTRDFIHNAVFQFDPVNPAVTNPALFFTRWITHFCAPTFVFLAGTSIYLQSARGKSKGSLSRFLLTRGLWLIFLEFTLVRFGAFFNFDFRFLLMMQVIWVIGVSMMLMAFLIHLPMWLIAAFGFALIFFHNTLDKFQVPYWQGPASPVPGYGEKLWMILHQPFAAFPVAGFPSPVIFIVYPLIPWVGVMAIGYVFGAIYQQDSAQRKRLLMIIGLAATVLFLGIRLFNVYGDPNRWSSQPRGLIYTVLSFFNTTKYPPSLLFLLMTLGPAILTLAWFESYNFRELSGWRKFFITFGRVPLFFYLLQWPTAHLISLALHFAFGKPTGWLFKTPMDWNNLPRDLGFNLVVVYACWIFGVVLLYFVCRWFAGVKQQRKDWWLSYL